MTATRKWTALVPPALIAIAASVGLTASTGALHTAAATTVPHVMVIVDENTAYSGAQGNPSIVGNADAPYINNTLIAKYTSATNWFAVEHVSDYDYYDLVSGADQKGISKPVGGTTFVDQLASKGVSWKAYMEGMPSTCYTGGATGNYVSGHNPFVHFKSIVNNPSQCNNVVPYTQSQMTTDLNGASPPSFVWVTPDQCDDMHSKCAPTRNTVSQGDSWLATTIPAVQSTQWYKSGGIIVLTWDESVTTDSSGVPGTSDSGGHIATLVISAANNSPYAAAGDHFGTLHGLQNAYGVACLAASCISGHGDISGAFPATSPGSITGTVTNSISHSPISGATVACSVCTPTSTTTNGSGVYTLASAPVGSDSVTFSAAGYQPATDSVNVSSGQQATQNQALAPDGSITGTVTDAVSHNPISGATATCSVCSPTTATTNGSGVYTLTNAPPGSDSVTFSASGYQPATDSVTVSSGAAATQNQALAPDGSITGTVTDSSTTLPINGATVTCSVCSPTTATTNTLGSYTLTNAPPGSDSVTFSDTGYQSVTDSVTVTSGAQATQNQALTPGSSTGSITGTVTDSSNSQPINGATVACSVCTPTSVTTASNGTYTIASAPPGSDSVTFSATGYTSQTVSVPVTAGQPSTQNAALVPMHQFVFSDGFESGNFSAWTTTGGLTTESATVHSGSWAAQGVVNSASGFAQKSLPSTYSTGYERVWFNLTSMSTQVYLLQANTATNATVAIVYVSSKGVLGLQAADNSRHDSSTAVTTGSWHELELRFTVNGSAGSADIYLDGSIVESLTGLNLKSTPVGVMQIGDDTSHTWNAFFDDAAFDTQLIP